MSHALVLHKIAGVVPVVTQQGILLYDCGKLGLVCCKKIEKNDIFLAKWQYDIYKRVRLVTTEIDKNDTYLETATTTKNYEQTTAKLYARKANKNKANSIFFIQGLFLLKVFHWRWTR